MNAFSHLSNLTAEGSDVVRAGIKDLFGLNEISHIEKVDPMRCERAPAEFLKEIVAGQTVSLSRTEPAELEALGVSLLFLKTVSANRFLEFAYWDLLGRDVDVSGRHTYGSLDFSRADVRDEVITWIMSSDEYKAKQTDRPMFDKVGAYRLWRDRICVTTNGSHTFDNRRVGGIGGGSSKLPLIWRDPASKGETYLCFGMMLRAECRRDGLDAPPEWVFHGPKSPLGMGLYRLKLDMTADETDLFHFDVVHGGGTKVLFGRKFFGSQQCTEALDVPEGVTDLEVRLFNLTGRTVKIDIRELSLSLVL